MSWVPLVTVEEATSETKNIYDFLQNTWGFVPNYYQALGPYQQLLKDQVDMFTHACALCYCGQGQERTRKVARWRPPPHGREVPVDYNGRTLRKKDDSASSSSKRCLQLEQLSRCARRPSSLWPLNALST